jgi:hypothetical protein
LSGRTVCRRSKKLLKEAKMLRDSEHPAKWPY